MLSIRVAGDRPRLTTDALDGAIATVICRFAAEPSRLFWGGEFKLTHYQALSSILTGGSVAPCFD